MPPFRMVRPRRAWTPPKPKPPVYRGPKLLPAPPRGKRGRATAAAAPSFNPLTSWTTDPVHGVWASDPLWTPPADGGAVSSWRNGGSVGGDLVQATGAAQPTYDAVNAAFNNQAVVTFATDDVLAVDIADIAQPLWYVAIGKTNNAAILQRMVGVGVVSTYRGLGVSSGGKWSLALGGDVAGGTSDTDPHLLVGKASSTSSVVSVDGTVIASGDAGTSGLSILSLGAGSSPIGTYANYLNGSIALALVFDIDPTTQDEWPDFVAWAEATYGLTIA